jgi:hypothetical protein
MGGGGSFATPSALLGGDAGTGAATAPGAPPEQQQVWRAADGTTYAGPSGQRDAGPGATQVTPGAAPIVNPQAGATPAALPPQAPATAPNALGGQSPLVNAPLPPVRPPGLGSTLMPAASLNDAVAHYIASHIGPATTARIMAADPATPMSQLAEPGSLQADDMAKPAGQFIAAARTHMLQQGMSPGAPGPGSGTMSPVVSTGGGTPRPDVIPTPVQAPGTLAGSLTPGGGSVATPRPQDAMPIGDISAAVDRITGRTQGGAVTALQALPDRGSGAAVSGPIAAIGARMAPGATAATSPAAPDAAVPAAVPAAPPAAAPSLATPANPDPPVAIGGRTWTRAQASATDAEDSPSVADVAAAQGVRGEIGEKASADEVSEGLKSGDLTYGGATPATGGGAAGASETPPSPVAKLPPTPAAVKAGDAAVRAAATSSPQVAQSLASTRPGSDQRMLLLALMARAAAGSANPTGNLKFVEMLAGIEKQHQESFEKQKTPVTPAELQQLGLTPPPGAIGMKDAFGNISWVQGAAPQAHVLSPAEVTAAGLGDPGPNNRWQQTPDGKYTKLEGMAPQGHILSADEVKTMGLGSAGGAGRVWFLNPTTGKPEAIDAPAEEGELKPLTPAQQTQFPEAIGIFSGGKKDGQPFYPPASVAKSPEQLYAARLPVAQKLGLQPGTPDFNSYMAEGKLQKADLTPAQLKLSDASNASLAAIDENIAIVENAIEQAKSGQMNFGVAGRAKQALSGLPGMGTQASANTAAIDADIQNTIVGSLRTIFGGRVAIAEMKQVLGMKPSSSQSQAEFVAKAQDYVTHMRNVQAQEQNKNASIANGSYFIRGSGAGGPSTAPAPVAPGSPAGRAQTPAAAPQAPLAEGRTATGAGGKRMIVKDGRWQPL